MKRAKPSTGTSKRPRGEASTASPASGAMPTAEETYVDLTVAVDPSLTPCHDGVFNDYTGHSWIASR